MCYSIESVELACAWIKVHEVALGIARARISLLMRKKKRSRKKAALLVSSQLRFRCGAIQGSIAAGLFP